MTRSNRRTRADPITARRAGGRTVADGGRRDATDEDEASGRTNDEPTGRTRMKDVDHTPPYGDGASVDRVFERGGTEEPVESEE